MIRSIKAHLQCRSFDLIWLFLACFRRSDGGKRVKLFPAATLRKNPCFVKFKLGKKVLFAASAKRIRLLLTLSLFFINKANVVCQWFFASFYNWQITECQWGIITITYSFIQNYFSYFIYKLYSCFIWGEVGRTSKANLFLTRLGKWFMTTLVSYCLDPSTLWSKAF